MEGAKEVSDLNINYLVTRMLKMPLYLPFGTSETWWLDESALGCRLNGLDLSLAQIHCVVFLGKVLCSHSASIHPAVLMGNLALMEYHPI